MKRLGTMLAWISLGTFTAGCGGGGVEVGSPKEAPPSAVTNEFKEAMQKAGSKMMKKQMPKGGGATTKQ